jgi:membrane protein DedA with SNARE-associated domain
VKIRIAVSLIVVYTLASLGGFLAASPKPQFWMCVLAGVIAGAVARYIFDTLTEAH